MHGANALFGVVNVVTRKIAGRDEGRAGVALGSGRAGAASAMLNLAGDGGRDLLSELKTAIVYKLLMFVEWPTGAEPPMNGTLALCLHAATQSALTCA